MNASNIFLPILFFTAVGFVIGGALMWLVLSRTKPDKRPTPDEPCAETQQDKRYQEMVGLWREVIGGKLAVWYDKHLTTDVNQLAEYQRAQLDNLTHELHTWLDSAGKPAVQPADELSAAQLPVEAVQTGAAAALPFVQPVVKKALSIVEQIDEILQEMMVNTPLAKRSIHLIEDKREGVIVWVGMERFMGVDAVTEPEIKTVVRAAAAEWERRQEVNKR